MHPIRSIFHRLFIMRINVPLELQLLRLLLGIIHGYMLTVDISVPVSSSEVRSGYTYCTSGDPTGYLAILNNDAATEYGITCTPTPVEGERMNVEYFTYPTLII